MDNSEMTVHDLLLIKDKIEDAIEAIRYADIPDGTFYALGFRVVCELASSRAVFRLPFEPLANAEAASQKLRDACMDIPDRSRSLLLRLRSPRTKDRSGNPGHILPRCFRFFL